MAKLKVTIRPDTLVLSILAVSNEIAVIHHLKGIGKLCRSKNVIFHADTAQAAGKFEMDVKLNVDFLSISSGIACN